MDDELDKIADQMSRKPNEKTRNDSNPKGSPKTVNGYFKRPKWRAQLAGLRSHRTKASGISPVRSARDA